MQNSFLLTEIFCLYCTVVFALLCFFPFAFFCLLPVFRIFPALPPKQVRRRREPFGCAGCVSCCINEHSPSRFFRQSRIFLKISKYIWDPARGGVLEGGGSGGGLPPPRHGCCVQAPDYIWDPARGGVLERAVSKHQTVTFVFVLKTTLPRRNLASLCPGRREVRPRISTPLQHLRF